MSNVYDISIEQGSSFNLTLIAKDQLDVPLNLSGYTVTGGIKYGYGSSGYLVPLTAVIDPSLVSGLIDISLLPAQTSVLPVTKGVYDVEVTSSGGFVSKAAKGYIEITPEVTNG